MNYRVFSIVFLCFLLTQCSATVKKRSFGEVIDDNVIVLKLKTKYTKDKIVQAKSIKVKAWKGVVTLTGSVPSQLQINRAIEIAEQQRGVKEVKAYLILNKWANQTKKPSTKKTKKKSFWSVFKKKPKESVQEETIQEQRAGSSQPVVTQTDYKEFDF